MSFYRIFTTENITVVFFKIIILLLLLVLSFLLYYYYLCAAFYFAIVNAYLISKGDSEANDNSYHKEGEKCIYRIKRKQD